MSAQGADPRQARSAAGDAPGAQTGAARGNAADGSVDCLIVGAGPAGLIAATYLARFQRRVVVIDAGQSRARWIPTSHNCPGFPFGVGGDALLDKLRDQTERYDVRVVSACVDALAREGHGDAACFVASAGERRWRARCVILACGVRDRLPDVPGIEAAIETGAVRLCAICDGYEARDEQIAVYGPVDEAIGHAVFLRTFSRTVAVLPSAAESPSAETRAEAARTGVVLLPHAALRIEDGRCIAAGDDGVTHVFDTLYPVLGSDAQTDLALALGARCDDNRELIVDRQQQTSIDGLYACGDMVSALNQISVAVGHAAIAATAVHNRLPDNLR